MLDKMRRFNIYMLKCPKWKYPIEVCDKYDSILERQGTIHTFRTGKFDNVIDEDFRCAYANIMLRYKLPAGNILSEAPADGSEYATMYKVKVYDKIPGTLAIPCPTGFACWMWDEEYEFIKSMGANIIRSTEVKYMKLFDYSNFGKQYLEDLACGVSKDELIPLFGLFAYRVRKGSKTNQDGRRSKFKSFNNFFAISYVWMKVRLNIAKRCLDIHKDGGKIITISTDGITWIPNDRAPLYLGGLPYKIEGYDTMVHVKQGLFALFADGEMQKFAIQGQNLPFIPDTIDGWMKLCDTK